MEEDLVVRNFEQCRGQLKNRDWSALPAEAIDEDPAVTLNRIGSIMPQYIGRETFGITYQPGYDDAPYSQSINGFYDDTHAPGFEPPSKYPALHAHLSSLNHRIYRLDFSSTKMLCR
jgi:hypothetical protein